MIWDKPLIEEDSALNICVYTEISIIISCNSELISSSWRDG